MFSCYCSSWHYLQKLDTVRQSKTLLPFYSSTWLISGFTALYFLMLAFVMILFRENWHLRVCCHVNLLPRSCNTESRITNVWSNIKQNIWLVDQNVFITCKSPSKTKKKEKTLIRFWWVISVNTPIIAEPSFLEMRENFIMTSAQACPPVRSYRPSGRD